MDSPKIVLTGAGRGLGKVVLGMLIQKNPQYHVIATARSGISQLQGQVDKTYPNSHVKFMELDIQRKQSVENFLKEISVLGVRFDALVNNAALGCDLYNKVPSVELAQSTLKTNLYGTVNLTNGFLPFLKEDGRIIIVSSKLGGLCFHGKDVAEKFNNPTITLQQIYSEAENFIEGCKKGDIGGYFKSAYGTSKMMLNTWSRFILSKQLKTTQRTITMHPGHCKTDMGGSYAPCSAESGANLIYSHIWGQYKNDQFYSDLKPFNFYDCGPKSDLKFKEE